MKYPVLMFIAAYLLIILVLSGCASRGMSSGEWSRLSETVGEKTGATNEVK